MLLQGGLLILLATCVLSRLDSPEWSLIPGKTNGGPSGPGVKYVPWVDVGRRVCVFRCYSLPLDRCVCAYGWTEVHSWPNHDLNDPGSIIHGQIGPQGSIPGADLKLQEEEEWEEEELV